MLRAARQSARGCCTRGVAASATSSQTLKSGHLSPPFTYMGSGRITRNGVPASCRLVWGPLGSSLQPEAIATSGVYELRVRGVLLPDLPPMDVLIRRLRLHELVDVERRRDHL